jgi:predicted dehydrogenase
MRALREGARAIRAVRAGFHNLYGPGVEKRWFFDPKLSGGGALIDLGVHLLDLLLWLLKPAAVELSDARLQWPPVQSAEQLEQPPVESAARLRLQCDDVPVEVDVSWSAPRPHTEIALELETSTGVWRWENVDGSFFRFRTRRDGHMLLERETSLRSDTLRAFEHALHAGDAPPIDVRVYGLLEQAYQQAL